MTADTKRSPKTETPDWAPRLDASATMYSLTQPGAAGRNVPAPSRLIPLPDVPLNPVLSLGMTVGGGARVPSVLDAGEAVFTTAGRTAISLALEHMGVREGERVLLPAYHCIVMVEALEHVNAVPVYYRLKPDLSVDYDDVAAKIGPETRALLVPHYFGFPQDMPRARRFCDERGIKLIEDCAHAFFGEVSGRPIGAWGDYAIASVKKFFPAYDGGALVSPAGGLRSLDMKPQGLRAAISGARQVAIESVRCGRLWALRPLLAAAKAAVRTLRGESGKQDASLPAIPGDSVAAPESGAGYRSDFDPGRVHLRINGASDISRRLSATARIAARRRRNYLRMVRGLEGLPGCRPVFPRLPDGAVPFECAMWVDDLDNVFPALEDLAVPMHRFGQFLMPDMDESVCPVAAGHSHHGVQFACHQDLTEHEIDVVVARIRHAFGA